MPDILWCPLRGPQAFNHDREGIWNNSEPCCCASFCFGQGGNPAPFFDFLWMHPSCCAMATDTFYCCCCCWGCAPRAARRGAEAVARIDGCYGWLCHGMCSTHILVAWRRRGSASVGSHRAFYLTTFGILPAFWLLDTVGGEFEGMGYWRSTINTLKWGNFFQCLPVACLTTVGGFNSLLKNGRLWDRVFC